MTNRRLPPYGRELQHSYVNKVVFDNDLFICIGINAWNVARGYKQSGNAVLVLPPEKYQPCLYDWSIAKGQNVLILATETRLYQLVRELAYELLECAGAKVVRAASISGGIAVFRLDGEERLK